MESTKLPVMLWKTQLLDLVSEAPKAHCVECNAISNDHRSSKTAFFSFPSDSHDADVVDLVGGSESDLSSHHSIGISSSNGLDEVIQEFELTVNSATSNQNSLEKLTQAIQVNLTVDSPAINLVEANGRKRDPGRRDKGSESSLLPSYNHFRQNNSNGGGNSEDKILPEVDNAQLLNVPFEERRRSSKTAAAPWHRPSIYYFNPFQSAFHGSLTRSSVKRLLSLDGDFLVRKRSEDGDDEFVLSVKFNGRVKNFLIYFDDTSGLVYLANREKGFEHLEDLVNEGLVSMYVEHRAGPYIDLLYDLTQNEQQQIIGGCSKYLDSLSSKTKGGTFTADCIYEFFDNSKIGDGVVAKPSRFGHKQNSPSPVSSLSGSSLERIIRQPDLKSHSFKTHTFLELSKCTICRNFLWGLSCQGLLCEHCDLIIHEGCIAKLQQECEPNIEKLPSVFGVSLTLMVKATAGSRPPFLLQKCITEIDKRGLQVEGIFRISGPREATERLKLLFERDRNNADLSQFDIHSMCSVVKFYLRDLPQPLISEDVFGSFLKSNIKLGTANSTNTEYNLVPTNITVDSVRRELKKLPPAHYITLKYLLQHLHRVAERSELNKMNPFNLSSIFAPTLFCPAQISIETLHTGTVLLELMITQVRNLFPKA